MDTDTLRLFVQVAKSGSFSAVARERALDPSSVSRAIAALEQDLGLQLFQRTTRRLALSEAGAGLLERVDSLLDELDHALDDARALASEPTGTLRMTASVSFGLAQLVPLLPEFRAEYPRLAVELLLSDQNLDLLGDRIDLAIRLGPRTPTGHGLARLLSTRYRVVATGGYLRSHPPITAPEDVGQHRCLLFALPDYRSRWLFRDARQRLSTVPVHGDLVISNALGLRACALAGMGLALLPDWLVRDPLSTGQLVAVLADFEVTATEFDTAAWALYPEKSFVPTKVKVMMAFLREHLARMSHRVAIDAGARG